LKYDWDGKDQNGRIVKNGCYIPRLRIESPTDQVSFQSSTQQLKDVEVKPDYYDRVTGVLSYTLSQSSLVTVKAEVPQHNKNTGEMDHIVKKVIANNAARTAGKVVEYFDGYSDDGVYLPNSNYTITILTKPLPPNAVIVYGGEDPGAGGSQ
jgi:flagellar hook assembly protein FlgD